MSSLQERMRKACVDGDVASVQELVASDLSSSCLNKDGSTALMLASYHGSKDIVEVLLSANADVNHQNIDGSTALMLASQNGFKDIVEVLLSANADVNLQNKQRKKAAMMASNRGHHEIVDLFSSFFFEKLNQEIEQRDDLKRERDELTQTVSRLFSQAGTANHSDHPEHNFPSLKISTEWGFKRNVFSRPEDMDLEVGDSVLLLSENGSDSEWWNISHATRGNGVVHTSCFRVVEVASSWRFPANRFARPEDQELKKGERVVISEKCLDWWRVVHLETGKELSVHCSAFC